MVPQFALEVWCVGTFVLDVGHNGYESFGTQVSLLSVFDLREFVDHILNVPTILRKMQSFSVDIIVLFHQRVENITFCMWFSKESSDSLIGQSCRRERLSARIFTPCVGV